MNIGLFYVCESVQEGKVLVLCVCVHEERHVFQNGSKFLLKFFLVNF